MNENWTDRLSEYLDGEMGRGATEALEARLAEDPGLRETLDELRAVKTAAANSVDGSPATDLWPEIRDRIQAAPVALSLIHISEPTRPMKESRLP